MKNGKKGPASEAHKKSPVAVNEESLAAGKEAYDGPCVECHEISGKNDGKKIAEMKKEDKDRMKVVSDPVERRALQAHVREEVTSR